MDITPAASTQDDEVDLLGLLGVLWRRKKMIIATSVIAMVLSVAIMIISLTLPPETSFLPNLYRPQALMLINDSSSSGGQLSSMLNSSGLGSLASLAGLGGGGSTYSQLAVYLASSNNFLDSIVDEFDLINRYKIIKHPRAESRSALKKLLKADFDSESGVYTLSYEDYDPVFARDVIAFATDYMEKRFRELGVDKNAIEKINLEQNIENTYQEIRLLEKASRELELSVSQATRAMDIPSIMLEASRIKREIDAQEQVYTQLKIQYELVKVKLASETPVFQVLERPEVPDKKASPSRGLITIVICFAAFFLSVLAAFILDAIEGIKKDPAALKRFTGDLDA